MKPNMKQTSLGTVPSGHDLCASHSRAPIERNSDRKVTDPREKKYAIKNSSSLPKVAQSFKGLPSVERINHIRRLTPEMYCAAISDP